MSIIDWIVVFIIIILFGLSIYSIKKHGSCTSGCEGCHKSCSPAKKEKHDTWIDQYKKDQSKGEN